MIGNGDPIRLLLDHGAYAHTDPTARRSALHLLTRLDPDHADIARAERVLQQGVDVDTRYAGGPTPFFEALQSGNWSMARFLLDRGAQINRRDARAHRDLLCGSARPFSASELLARPGDLASLESSGLGWLIAYVRKMAAGERFGVSELLRGNAVVHRRGDPPAGA